MKFNKYVPIVAALCTATALTPLVAQTVEDNSEVLARIMLPENERIFAPNDPNVRRASARVNGEVITGTDIDQRLAFLAQGNQAQIPPTDLAQLRARVLGELIDETLKTQAATVDEMDVKQTDVDDYFKRMAQGQFKMPPAEVEKLLTSWGSSTASFKRQLRAEIAWSRLISRHVRPGAQVSEAEIKKRIEQRIADKGKPEYHVAEIFLAGTVDQQDALLERAKRILDDLGQGGDFAKIAGKLSETTTRSKNGDLGWVKAEVLPTEMATAVQSMKINEVVVVPAPGGISLVLLVDKRIIGVVDPRDATLSLKQIAINFTAPMTEAQFAPVQAKFSEAISKINGCGPADDAAKAMGAEVVNRDDMKIRNLPGPLQEIMLQLQIGQSTPAYGSPQDGLRSFVLCGRDMPQAESDADLAKSIEEEEDERVQKRARTYLRDLRRDAIIEYN